MIGTLYQERFSDAFITAISAMAECTAVRPTPDLNGIDWHIGSNLTNTTLHHPAIDIQVKSSAVRRLRFTANSVTYDLEVDNYSLLIPSYFTPRLLVLVTLPDDHNNWLTLNADYTVLKHTAFYVNLLGAPASSNANTTAVSIPLQQQLTPSSLLTLLHRAGNLQRL